MAGENVAVTANKVSDTVAAPSGRFSQDASEIHRNGNGKLHKNTPKSGKIYSFTNVRQSASGKPFVLALVRLSDGSLVMGQVVDVAERDLKIGLPVEPTVTPESSNGHPGPLLFRRCSVDLQKSLLTNNLEGKRALVTGGSRGLGEAIALTLAAHGADVAITYRSGRDEAQSVCDRIQRMGRKAKSYAVDMGDAASLESLAPQVLESGEVDVLVNNAGITRDRSFKKMTQDMWDEVVAVNLTGVFSVTKQFIDAMAERSWGRVVNISSIVGEVGNFGQANYAAAKAGLIGFTKSLAREYARKGVTLNAVAPPYVRKRMLKDDPDKVLDSVKEMTPVGRLGEPAEIAAGVAFLASPAASYVTGHVLDINGGMAM